MTRVSLVGLQPEAVDYSDPALPPAMDAKKIWAGIDLALKQMTDLGWQAGVCLIQPDATAGPALERWLGATTCDCVVIGAGVRLPPNSRRFLMPYTRPRPTPQSRSTLYRRIVPTPRLAGYPPASDRWSRRRACFPHNAYARAARARPAAFQRVGAPSRETGPTAPFKAATLKQPR
jgi:hypothetical protein